jgi:hypothetical protein
VTYPRCCPKRGRYRWLGQIARLVLLLLEPQGGYLAGLLIELGFQAALFEKAPHPHTEGYGILLVLCLAILPGPISGRNSGQG